jgi:hypothetical protein
MTVTGEPNNLDASINGALLGYKRKYTSWKLLRRKRLHELLHVFYH